MNKAINIKLICAGIAALLLGVTSNVVFAQNLTSIVDVNSNSNISNVSNDSNSFAHVSLTEADPIENVSVLGAIGETHFSEESSNYTLGKEDVIRVSVARHPEVSGNFIINGEGKIQYEFIGDIAVEGLKKDEVKQLVTERLSEYIISPDVTVIIVGYNSKIVYVVGEVRSPGKIYMRGDTITVREALVQAGLPMLTGKLSQGKLITPSETGKAKRLKVNVHKLLYEGDLRENLVMKPGDTLYIPPTAMTKAMRVIQPVSQPLSGASSIGRKATTGF